MDSSYWRMERWRLVLVLFLAMGGGLLSGQWFASLALVLAGYVGWLLFKLHELLGWLEQGASAKSLPDCNGIWERIVFHVQSLQRKNAKRKKAMSRLLKRSQSIVSALPYAAVLLNDDHEIDWANKAAKHYLNIDNRKDRGFRIENLLRIPELYTLLKKQSKDEIEVVYPPASGRYLAIRLVMIKKGPQLLIARDVSERVHLQETRRNFIANASHELRTPLTVVSGYLEMLQSDEALPEHLQPAVRAAAGQASQMQQIIEELMTLSRLESSMPAPADQSLVDMPALLETECLPVAARLAGDTHSLHADIDPALKIRGVPSEIISVCNNLVGNAIRHTPPGTSVTIEWKRVAQGRACLAVRDDGDGIAAQHLPHLTERFYRVDNSRSRKTGGTGLGLAIVDHIMRRHGGRLLIESEVGKGSVFSACFPLDEPSTQV